MTAKFMPLKNKENNTMLLASFWHWPQTNQNTADAPTFKSLHLDYLTSHSLLLWNKSQHVS